MQSPANNEPYISVIIPNRNGRLTIGKCLDAALSSRYGNFEVIVVDDASTDGSADVIGGYPCRLVRLKEHGGASKARNTGAGVASGEALFFTDSDCVLRPDTLLLASKAYRDNPDAVVGGTYTPLPHDKGFFNTFQSVFVHHSETKKLEPDYVATHAMLASRELFARSGGFREDFMPILEDVEFSHRIRKSGIRLVMRPEIVVEHIFNFNLWRSLRNAFRKSMFWTMYSIGNRDLLSDSGTASIELKANTLCWASCLGLAGAAAYSGEPAFAMAAAPALALNLLINRRFMTTLVKTGGPAFGVAAALYYMALYPAAVGSGGLVGAVRRP